MSNRFKALLAAYLTITAVFFCGCNAFEGFDHDLRGRSREGRRDEARLALNEAKYEKAKELYDLLITDGDANDEVYRGRASAIAGLAGFNMFKALDVLQNDSTIPADSSAVIFKAAKAINGLELLQDAIFDMKRVASPSQDDLLFRGLLASVASAMRVWQVYDTNLNKKLDKPDKVEFDVENGSDKVWVSLYGELQLSLDASFNDLAKGLSGRGEPWSFVSPFGSGAVKGEYTAANRKIISAVLSLSEGLKLANTHFNSSSPKGFKAALLSLDGEQ